MSNQGGVESGVEIRSFDVNHIKRLPNNELTLSYLKCFIDALSQSQAQSQAMKQNTQEILGTCDHLIRLIDVAKAFEKAIKPEALVAMMKLKADDCSLGNTHCHVIRKEVKSFQTTLNELMPIDPLLFHSIRPEHLSEEDYLDQFVHGVNAITTQPQMPSSRPDPDHTSLLYHTGTATFIHELNIIYQDKKAQVAQLLSTKHHQASTSKAGRWPSAYHQATACVNPNFFKEQTSETTKEAKREARKQLDKRDQKAEAHLHRARTNNVEINTAQETENSKTSPSHPLFKLQYPRGESQTFDSANTVKLDGMQHVYLVKSNLEDIDLSAFETVLRSPSILGLTTKNQSGLKLHQGQWASIRKAAHSD